MAPRFYSKEWVEAVKHKANSDKDYLKKTEKFTAKNLFIVTDCPDGNDVKLLWTFDKGKVVDYEYKAKPAPADFRMDKEPWNDSISLFRAQGSYDTYVKIQKRELSVMGAMGAKLYKYEGNMAKAMSMIGYNTAFADLQTSVPTEY